VLSGWVCLCCVERGRSAQSTRHPEVTLAIGLDIGSTNVKAALIDDSATLLASATRPLTTTLEAGRAEQDPDEIWKAVQAAIVDLAKTRPLRDVRGIGIDSQYSSTIPVGADATPVGPCILYLDHRGTDHSHAIFARHEAAFSTWVEHHGIPPVGGGLSLAHILHFQHDEPAVHERTHAYVEVMDYIAARLTGRIAATQCTMFTAQLCDNRMIGTTEYDDELIGMSGVDATRLPPLEPNDGVRGEVRTDVAGSLGLPSGVIVAAPMNDSHAAAFATGAFAPGTVGLMMGTTAVLLDTVEAMRADYERELLTMPSPDGRYLVWAENGLAGRVVAHVLDDLFHATDALADHAIDDPFANLDAALDASQPGADGLIFLPWLAGSMSPVVDPTVRGGYLGMSLTTTRTDMVRATVEGTAHNAAWLLRAVEDFTGHRTDEVVFGGGAARSPGWAQILADVLDRPVRPLDDPEYAVARATAEIALARTDHTEGPVGVHLGGRLHEPQAATRDRYGADQHRFEAAFDALQAISQAPTTPPALL
jgi:xylulokinase